MNKVEKIQKLKEILAKLKLEFVGLDNIIDEIGESLIPWYVTPEVIKRPLVISLWGMTGTGKTSLVNRLIQLLELDKKTFTFDCGEESTNLGKASSITSKLEDFFNADEINVNADSLYKDLVFVFDEFQHARTLSEDGCETNKSDFRPVWGLIDSGIIENHVSNWNISNLINFIQDLSDFIESHPGIKLNSGDTISDPNIVKEVLENMGYFYFNRPIPGVGTKYSEYDDDTDKDPYRPLCMLDWDNKRRIQRYHPEKLEVLKKCNTLEDLLEVLKEVEEEILVPKRFDCSKSLIFILGNLDEAFDVGNEINPDIDAEVFYGQTSKVSISDIKAALQRRFRAEQIARFGNNLIKYPTLNSEHFKEIISREISRVICEFKKENRIDIFVSDSFKDLIYSEGVYPVQGVRPIFSTIGNILMPLLSDILINYENEKHSKYVITTEDSSFNRDIEKIKIYDNESKEVCIEKTIQLALGKLRNPKSKKTRFINSVHEAGHAIVMAYLTGNLPMSIVSVSSAGGGFCITYNEDWIKEIDRKIDIDNSVKISLGGYIAERLIFKDENLCLLGSGSDLDKAWTKFSDSVYNQGYFDSFKIYNENIMRTKEGIPSGLSKKSLEIEASKRFEGFSFEVEKILNDNKKLLVKMALYLGEHGTMKDDKFREYISAYGKTLNSEHLNSKAEYLSDKYYENILRNLDI